MAYPEAVSVKAAMLNVDKNRNSTRITEDERKDFLSAVDRSIVVDAIEEEELREFTSWVVNDVVGDLVTKVEAGDIQGERGEIAAKTNGNLPGKPDSPEDTGLETREPQDSRTHSALDTKPVRSPVRSPALQPNWNRLEKLVRFHDGEIDPDASGSVDV